MTFPQQKKAAKKKHARSVRAVMAAEVCAG